MSPLSRRVRDAVHGLPDAARDDLGRFIRESPTARALRHPGLHQSARPILARMGWKPAPGQSHGAALLDVLCALNDPGRERAVKTALGLPRDATRSQILAGVLEIVPELAHTPSELQQLLDRANANDVRDQLYLRRFQADLDANQKPDRVPPPRPESVERERDAANRRQLITNLYDAGTARAARGRRHGEYFQDARRLDIARHYDAAQGRMTYADPSSPGVKEWMKGVTEADWAVEGERMEAIRADAREARASEEAFEGNLAPDADIADAWGSQEDNQ